MMTWGGGVWKQDLGVGPLSQVRLSVFKVDVIGPSYGAADFSGDMSADARRYLILSAKPLPPV